jgi:tRNA U38,U39,U40 pseudouridine synthase TruA
MINYELQNDKGILVLHPEGLLEAADFISITSQVDTYLAGHGKLHGVLIHAKSFPGWKDFAAMLAHLKFLKEHIQKIEKVAVVADGALANIMPKIANHFVHAQVRHFDFEREDSAWDWINQTDKAQMSSVA